MNVFFGYPSDAHGTPLGWHVFHPLKKRTIFLGCNMEDCYDFVRRFRDNGFLADLEIRAPYNGYISGRAV